MRFESCISFFLDWRSTKHASLILLNSSNFGSEESEPRSRATVAATALTSEQLLSLWENALLHDASMKIFVIEELSEITARAKRVQ